MTSGSSFSAASVNVNGIRAAYRKGMREWLEVAAPDLLLLQEVRAEEDIARTLLGNEYQAFIAPSLAKGRAGVAVAVRRSSPSIALDGDGSVRIGLQEIEDPVDSGRWLEVDVVTSSGMPIRAISAYFHSGEAKNQIRQSAKMRHLAWIDQRMDALYGMNQDGGGEILVSGDFNVVRGERDIKNWRSNHNRTSGVLDEEMAYLNQWVERGWDDLARTLSGEVQGPYSWWSMRGKAFDNDTGWRIDYHYSTPELAARARACRVDRAASWDTRFSDHAPVVVDFAI